MKNYIVRRRKKPDLFVVLSIIVALGVIISSLAQGISRSPETHAAQLAAAKPATHTRSRQP